MFKKSRIIKKAAGSSFPMVQHMYSKEEFHAIIAYERSRCDREGSVFSVILVNSSLFGLLSKVAFLKFAKGLKKLLRDIDHIGWWESETLAVLLPSTDIVGARVCSGKVERYLKNSKVTPSVSVISYPNHWLESHEPCEVKDMTKDTQLSFEKVFAPELPLWKRAFDILGAFCGIIVLSPVFLIVALYLKSMSPGRIFTGQKRIGRHGKEFNLYKFRTLDNDADGEQEIAFLQEFDVPIVRLDDRDSHVIRGRKFLKKLCIDELPQLFNVIIGDMSLVGPRPCVPYEKENYLRLHPNRFDVIPGITGISQISGNKALTLRQITRLDKVYGMNISWWTDSKIVLLSIPAMIKRVVGNLKLDKNAIITGEPIPDLRGTVHGS